MKINLIIGSDEFQFVPDPRAPREITRLNHAFVPSAKQITDSIRNATGATTAKPQLPGIETPNGTVWLSPDEEQQLDKFVESKRIAIREKYGRTWTNGENAAAIQEGVDITLKARPVERDIHSTPNQPKVDQMVAYERERFRSVHGRDMTEPEFYQAREKIVEQVRHEATQDEEFTDEEIDEIEKRVHHDQERFAMARDRHMNARENYKLRRSIERSVKEERQTSNHAVDALQYSLDTGRQDSNDDAKLKPHGPGQKIVVSKENALPWMTTMHIKAYKNFINELLANRCDNGFVLCNLPLILETHGLSMDVVDALVFILKRVQVEPQQADKGLYRVKVVNYIGTTPGPLLYDAVIARERERNVPLIGGLLSQLEVMGTFPVEPKTGAGCEPHAPTPKRDPNLDITKPPRQYESPWGYEKDTRLFAAIMNQIRDWDINVPTWYGGYTGAMGNHACAILRAIVDNLTPETINTDLELLIPAYRRRNKHPNIKSQDSEPFIINDPNDNGEPAPIKGDSPYCRNVEVRAIQFDGKNGAAIKGFITKYRGGGKYRVLDTGAFFVNTGGEFEELKPADYLVIEGKLLSIYSPIRFRQLFRNI